MGKYATILLVDGGKGQDVHGPGKVLQDLAIHGLTLVGVANGVPARPAWKLCI